MADILSQNSSVNNSAKRKFTMNDYFSFDTDLACVYSVDGAIFLEYIRLWLKCNRDKNINYHEGKFWTYETMEKISVTFPFWTVKQIRRIIKNLYAQGAIEIGNFNKKGYDRTHWYTLSDDLYPEKYKIIEKVDEKPNKIHQVPIWSDQTGATIPSKEFNIYIETKLAHSEEQKPVDDKRPPGYTKEFLDHWKSKGLKTPISIPEELAQTLIVAEKISKTSTSLQALKKAIDNYAEVREDKTINYAYKDVTAARFLSLKSNREPFFEQFLPGVFDKTNFGSYNYKQKEVKKDATKTEIKQKIENAIAKQKSLLETCGQNEAQRIREIIIELEQRKKMI